MFQAEITIRPNFLCFIDDNSIDNWENGVSSLARTTRLNPDCQAVRARQGYRLVEHLVEIKASGVDDKS